MYISFVCPSVKESRLFFSSQAAERFQISVCPLPFVTSVFCCINEAPKDREMEYQYLEETFGMRPSFMEKKQKARKYDPRLFWESFSKNEKTESKKVRLIRRKQETTRNVHKTTLANTESFSALEKPSKSNVWQGPTWTPKVKEPSRGKYLSTCPITQLVSLETSQNVALAYLDMPCSDSDLKKLLGVVKKVSFLKVTLILKGADSSVLANSMSFVEMVGKENCYIDTKSCFFQEKVVTPGQSCCVMLTCNENDATIASHSIQQIIQSLQNSTWKVQLYGWQEARQCLLNSCRKLPDSLISNEKYTAQISSPVSEILHESAFSANDGTKRNSVKEEKARIVVNHSTYIPGLIKSLELLSEEPCVQTIVPGRLRNGKSRSPHLLLRVTTTTPTGYKLLARKGTTVQEVFIVTSAERQFIEEVINKVNKEAS
ncbi:hypothetical protein Gasu2_69160 [Galdieria sulphuraria]|nr:hypothetical protein Gasu2_69160 [Galdieria sulphuraria]